MIAHRLSTIRSADQILVLEGGEIVESGTHEPLIARDGRSKQLCDKQYNFERDRFITARLRHRRCATVADLRRNPRPDTKGFAIGD